MATTYIQFTGRLKATSQEGILAEAQQVAVSSTDSTNIKTYIDNKIKEVQGNISSVAGSVYRPKGSLTVANFKALTSAAVGDVYNITEQFTLSGRTYPAYTNVACVKAFSAAVTPDDSYWDALGGTVDLSPYAKTADVNTKVDTLTKSISDNVSTLNTKISTAQSTANTANTTANTNKTNITNLTGRVTTLEGSDHVNKINTVKVNGTALTPDASKAVNIPLASTSAAGLMSTDDKQKVDWSRKYIQQGDAEHPFLQGTLDADAFTYNIGWMLDGNTYNNAVKIPLTNEEQAGLVDSTSYTEYLQPLLQGQYDERIDKKVDAVAGKGLSTNDYTTAEKNKLAGIAAGANKYTLPAATASALGGVKVGQVYAIGTILPTVATVNLRASDNVAVVPAATTSAAGVMTAADKKKLNDIADSIKNSVTIGTGFGEYGDDGVEFSILGKKQFVITRMGSGVELYSMSDYSEKRLLHFSGMTFISGGYDDYANLSIEGNVYLGTYNDYSGDCLAIGSDVMIGTNGKVLIGGYTSIGQNVNIDPYISIKLVGTDFKIGTGGYMWSLAKQSDLTTLESRITALENLLKLA